MRKKTPNITNKHETPLEQHQISLPYHLTFASTLSNKSSNKQQKHQNTNTHYLKQKPKATTNTSKTPTNKVPWSRRAGRHRLRAVDGSRLVVGVVDGVVAVCLLLLLLFLFLFLFLFVCCCYWCWLLLLLDPSLGSRLEAALRRQ